MELGSECLVIDDWQFGITVVARETIIVMLQDIWQNTKSSRVYVCNADLPGKKEEEVKETHVNACNFFFRQGFVKIDRDDSSLPLVTSPIRHATQETIKLLPLEAPNVYRE
ncbi:hypothetical protein GmHk_03G007106 [Glycine max]|nr:hypothetical protein GmHk_03G007106 [Glycine max]